MSTPALLDQRFEVEPSYAEQMWGKSVELAEFAEHPQRRLKAERIRRFCGFVIRMLPSREIELDPEKHVSICKSELDRLSATGISNLSYAITVSSDRSRIFTITPYAPGLKECKPEEFEEKLCKPLVSYFNEVPDHGKQLSDIDDPGQFSTHPGLKILDPFLHDVDPYLDVVTRAA